MHPQTKLHIPTKKNFFPCWPADGEWVLVFPFLKSKRQ